MAKKENKKNEGGLGAFFRKIAGGRSEKLIEQALLEPGHGLKKEKKDGYYEIHCPYCLEKFNVWEMPFRALSVSAAEVKSEDLRASGTNAAPARKKEEAREARPAAAENYFPVAQDAKLNQFNLRMQKKDDAMRGTVLTLFKPDSEGGAFDGQNITRAVLFDTGEEIEVKEDNKSRLYHKAIASVRDSKGHYTTERLCPCCHNTMPDPVGQIPSYVVLFVGNTSSGKTVYMIRLLYELSQKGLLQGHPITVGKRYCGSGLDVDYWYNQTFTAMKKKVQSAAATQREGGPRITDPTKVRYIDPVSLVLMRDGQEVALLTLFDFPGEAIWAHAEDKAFQEVMRQRMTSVDGMIFLLDPTSMELARSLLPKEYLPVRLNKKTGKPIREEDPSLHAGSPVPERSAKPSGAGGMVDENRARYEANADPATVLNAFIDNYIPNLRGSKLDVPVSIVYSKSDLLKLLVQMGRDPDLQNNPLVSQQLAPRTWELGNPARSLTNWTENRIQDSAARTEYEKQMERLRAEQMHTEVDMEDILLADQELRGFLGPDLPYAALHSFPRALLFATSAVGAPVSSTEFSEAPPIRLTEPLEYLLWQMGLAGSEMLPDAWRLTAAKLKQPELDAE